MLELLRMENVKDEPLITIPAAAQRAGIGLRLFRTVVARSEFPVYQIGEWQRVRWSEVRAWIDRQQATQPRAAAAQ